MGQGVSLEHVEQEQGILEVHAFEAPRMYNLPPYMMSAYYEYCQQRYHEAMAVLRSGELHLEGKTMKCYARVHGQRPPAGYKIMIGMHGGGGCPTSVNDSQWANHKRLYKENMPNGTIWIAPRAPEDAWNMWHLPYVDKMFEKIFEYLTIVGIADPNKLYITGYSAGGDGVYRLGTRMADWLAGAAMCAGHPGDTTLKNCRNIGFCLHVGGEDHAYDRANIGRKLTAEMAKLKEQDGGGGYDNYCMVHEDKGHWMDRQDAPIFEWLGARTRNPHPTCIIWQQDCDVVKDRFYWIGVSLSSAKPGNYLEATLQGNTINIKTKDYSEVTLYLSDALLNLDMPVTVLVNGTFYASEFVQRDMKLCRDSLVKRGDPYTSYCAALNISIPH